MIAKRVDKGEEKHSFGLSMSICALLSTLYGKDIHNTAHEAQASEKDQEAFLEK